MAETVKKGARITGADRAKLVGEVTMSNAAVEIGEVPDESSSVPEEAAPEGPGRDG